MRLNRRRFVVRSVASCTAALSAAHTAAAAFGLVTDVPSVRTEAAAHGPLIAVARAGKRLVAAGWRGHIVYSEDDGGSWRQAEVPVSSDLLALSFPTATTGWAVGHGGVVLSTRDGGTTWTRLLHGSALNALTVKFYGDNPALSSLAVQRAINQARSASARDASPSLMDVCFESDKVGWVVGTFNFIFRTEDGGQTWMPCMHRINNERELHFNAVVAREGTLYLAGEQGMVWRLSAGADRFVSMPTGYAGTLFGLVAGAGLLVAFGMRGSVLRSADLGRIWEKIQFPTQAGVTAGGVVSPDEILLATEDGSLAISRDGARTFARIRTSAPMPYFGMSVLETQRVALSGAAGVRVEKLA
jgi:photosystem II stability/assembly factor-like uncharacterized protein